MEKIMATKTKKVRSNNVKSLCDKKIKCDNLVIEGTEYKTKLNYKFKNRKIWEPPNPKMIHSLIPGTILKIHVKEGDVLKKGEKIVILEAMKMRNIITMPMDGTIKKLFIEEEQKIPNGHKIMEIK